MGSCAVLSLNARVRIHVSNANIQIVDFIQHEGPTVTLQSTVDCGERDRFEIIDAAVVVVVEVLAV